MTRIAPIIGLIALGITTAPAAEAGCDTLQTAQLSLVGQAAGETTQPLQAYQAQRQAWLNRSPSAGVTTQPLESYQSQLAAWASRPAPGQTSNPLEDYQAQLAAWAALGSSGETTNPTAAFQLQVAQWAARTPSGETTNPVAAYQQQLAYWASRGPAQATLTQPAAAYEAQLAEWANRRPQGTTEQPLQAYLAQLDAWANRGTVATASIGRVPAKRAALVCDDVVASTGVILFDSSRATLSADSRPTIDGLIQIAKACPQVRIEISGHSDTSGPAASNNRLAERRARTVGQTLVNAGIPALRIDAINRGTSLPVASNDTAENRALNRRVEFAISIDEAQPILSAEMITIGGSN